MPKGVKIEELKIGARRIATRNDSVRIRFNCFLSRGDVVNTAVECSVHLFRRDAIAGLRYGIERMRQGGRRKIRVSPHLGYGEQGTEGLIPPNAALIFDIACLEIRAHASTRKEENVMEAAETEGVKP